MADELTLANLPTLDIAAESDSELTVGQDFGVFCPAGSAAMLTQTVGGGCFALPDPDDVDWIADSKQQHLIGAYNDREALLALPTRHNLLRALACRGFDEFVRRGRSELGISGLEHWQPWKEEKGWGMISRLTAIWKWLKVGEIGSMHVVAHGVIQQCTTFTLTEGVEVFQALDLDLSPPMMTVVKIATNLEGLYVYIVPHENPLHGAQLGQFLDLCLHPRSLKTKPGITGVQIPNVGLTGVSLSLGDMIGFGLRAPMSPDVPDIYKFTAGEARLTIGQLGMNHEGGIVDIAQAAAGYRGGIKELIQSPYAFALVDEEADKRVLFGAWMGLPTMSPPA